MDIKLNMVKTLSEWFDNIPLIYKIDLYNSYTDVLAKHTIKKEEEDMPF